MYKIYQLFIQFYLFIPIILILNNIIVNLFPEIAKNIQRPINNFFYFIIFLSSLSIFLLYTINFRINNIFSLAPGIDLSLNFNIFNISFMVFYSLFFLFLNYQFQRTFKMLHLIRTYPLYNQQLSFIFYETVLIVFSRNLIVTTLLYMILIFTTILFLHNKDLKDIKSKYSYSFITGLSCSVFLFIIAVVFAYFTGEHNFNVVNVSNFWLILILIDLIAVNFLLPIYLIFSIQVFYEDLLPIFIIIFIPFVIVNTFLFTKVAMYIFNGVFDKDLFHYIGYFFVLLFFISILFLIKHIRNHRKFILLYNMSAFLIFIQQLLTAQNKIELLWEFLEFLFLLLIILINMLNGAGITILMLKTQITQTNILYTKTKGELRFYFCSMLYLIFFLVMSFFGLNFYNLNYLFLINILEIVIFFVICILYMYINTFKKPTTDKEMIPVKREEKRQMFIAPIFLMIISAVLFFFKGFIFSLLNNYI